MLLLTFEDRNAADLRGLQRLLRERNRIFVILDDVDLFAAQLANDGLHAHALHAHAGADGIDVLVLRHDRDLGALARLARYGANHNGVVVNLRHFGLEQVRDQFRSRARNHNLRTLRSFFHARDHAAHTLTRSERLQPRLLFLRHAPFGLAQVDDDVLTFVALDGGVDDLAHASDVLVVNRVAFGFAHLLEDDLLRQLRSDTSQNVGRLVGAEFASHLGRRIDPLSVVERDLRQRIFNLLWGFNDRLHGIGPNLAALLIEFGAQVLLRLVVFSGGHDDGIFHRADHNLRIDAFLPAESVDYVVEFTCHNSVPPYSLLILEGAQLQLRRNTNQNCHPEDGFCPTRDLLFLAPAGAIPKLKLRNQVR